MKIVTLTTFFFLIAGAIAYSSDGLSRFRHIQGNTIRLDNHLFNALPLDDGNAALVRLARRHVQSGAPISRRMAMTLPERSISLPNGMRIEHSIAFGAEGSTRDISTGEIRKPSKSRNAPFPEDWKYHSGGKSGLDLAIHQQKGRKTIVLIDRNRGTFLSITEQGT